MGRPIKKGLEYFPLDVTLNTKFELIEAEFGLTGFAIVVKLFQKIYGERGYYCEWTSEVALLFAHKVGAGGSVVSEIVNAAIKRGIFDKEMFDKFEILTSAGIQERYLAAKRMSDISKINPEYLLISVPKNEVFAAKTTVIATKKPINAANTPQSKVKESKGKESKVKESKVERSKDSSEQNTEPTAPPIITMPLNTNEEYAVDRAMVDEYKKLYPAVDIEQELNKMRGWLLANPKKRKTKSGINAFINRWLAKEQDKGRADNSVKATVKPNAFTNYTQKQYSDEEIEEILRRKAEARK